MVMRAGVLRARLHRYGVVDQGAVAAAMWSTALVRDGGVTLSGANLIATRGLTNDVNFDPVIATNGFSTGKRYWAVTFTDETLQGYTTVGYLMDNTRSSTTALGSDGFIYPEGTLIGRAISIGTTVLFAMDRVGKTLDWYFSDVASGQAGWGPGAAGAQSGTFLATRRDISGEIGAGNLVFPSCGVTHGKVTGTPDHSDVITLNLGGAAAIYPTQVATLVAAGYTEYA